MLKPLCCSHPRTPFPPGWPRVGKKRWLQLTCPLTLLDHVGFTGRDIPSDRGLEKIFEAWSHRSRSFGKPTIQIRIISFLRRTTWFRMGCVFLAHYRAISTLCLSNSLKKKKVESFRHALAQFNTPKKYSPEVTWCAKTKSILKNEKITMFPNWNMLYVYS